MEEERRKNRMNINTIWIVHEYFTDVAFDAQDERDAVDKMVSAEDATIVWYAGPMIVKIGRLGSLVTTAYDDYSQN